MTTKTKRIIISIYQRKGIDNMNWNADITTFKTGYNMADATNIANHMNMGVKLGKISNSQYFVRENGRNSYDVLRYIPSRDIKGRA